MSVSSHRFENLFNDPQRQNKETFNLRLSDLSSSFLSRKTRMHNIGYDFSLTEYRAHDDQRGRVLYGFGSVSPFDKLTLTGTGVYRVNPADYNAQREINPTLNVNTRDFPSGVDAGAEYSVHIMRYRDGTSWVWAGRNIYGFLYPGEYIAALDKFAIYLDYYNRIESKDPDGSSTFKLSIIPDENTFSREINETAGLLFFPAENLLFSTINSRQRVTSDRVVAPTLYTSWERAKLWLENGSSVEGNIEIRKRTDLLRLHANALYEHRWSESLLTGVGAFGTRHSENYIIDLYAGPQFIVSFTKDFGGFIRGAETSHAVRISVNNEERSKPDGEYAAYLRLKMPKNVSFVAESNVTSRRLRDIRGSGAIYLHAGF
jgi:hypothetical protein